MAQTTALEIRDLHKSYGQRQALTGIQLAITPGERVALLGPNGAGKTTLFKSISGAIHPSSGSIHIFEHHASSPEARTLLGLVPQEIALYLDLTVQQNLQVFGRLLGLTSTVLKQRLDWALAWTGLHDRRHHLVKSLSGGMQRRLNIACGCLHNPRILILDEPTVGVDPQSRLRIFEMLTELNNSGITLVLTTHQLEEAQHHCNRIVMLDHGRIIADGSLSDLIEQTVGSRRRVLLSTQGEMHSAIPELVWNSQQSRWLGSIEHVQEDLVRLMDKVIDRGAHIVDIEVRTPSLQDVFLHLTGRDLRE